MEMSLKRAFQKCMTRGGNPQGASPNSKSVTFWGYYVCAFPFPASRPTLPSLISPLSHFSPSLPFPKEVNKKLSYHERK